MALFILTHNCNHIDKYGRVVNARKMYNMKAYIRIRLIPLFFRSPSHTRIQEREKKRTYE